MCINYPCNNELSLHLSFILHLLRTKRSQREREKKREWREAVIDVKGQGLAMIHVILSSMSAYICQLWNYYTVWINKYCDALFR